MYLGLGLAASFLALAVSAQVVSARTLDFFAVEEAVRDAVASGEIPGAVVVVGQGEQVLYRGVFGLRRSIPPTESMTADTVFDIASLTKPLGTTLAIMSLAERGKLSLDASIGTYLPEFRRRATPAFGDVTIRRLLTHTAGLPAIPPPGSVERGFPAAAKALAEVKLDYVPGVGQQYSDMGFILLGEVVRKVSGVPLDRYLRQTFFDPLGLRSTAFNPGEVLRTRAAPTEFHHGHLLVGEVHDPRARALGGVAGHAGMFSTADDLARLCLMLLNRGTLDRRQFLKPETVNLMWTPWPRDDSPRALGWDISSGYSRTSAPFFPTGAVGHLGFTGTLVWLDPPTRTYLILLTNRVHPSGGGSVRIRELRSRVSAAVGAVLFGGALPATSPGETQDTAADPTALPARLVGTGLDVLVSQGFTPLAGRTVGLITNATGIDATGRRNIDLLARAPGVRLAAIFSPEHGLAADANSDVPHGRDATTGLPVWSLYGATRRPTPAMLQGLTALVFDIQDVGTRYYTYLTTLVYAMEEGARHQIPLFVLDRPNPITGRVVEGPLMDADFFSFTGPHSIPVRTGLTIGEFARLAAAERRIPVALTVVPLVGWERGRWFDDTGLPWVNPSPNIRSVTQALLYSGIGLLEATNLSVGRGTETPFEVVGAPWIEPYGLAAALNARALPGVHFDPAWFTPNADIYAGQQCGGVRLTVLDRDAVRSVTTALALATELRERHREQFRPEAIQYLLMNRSTMWAFLRGEPLGRLTAWAEANRPGFLQRRASYLMY